MKDVFAPNGGIFARQLATFLLSRGDDISTAIEDEAKRHAFLSKPDPVIATQDHFALFKRAEAVSDNPHIGLEFARHCNIMDAGLLGYALKSSATLDNGLRTIEHLSSTFVPLPVQYDTRPERLSWGYVGLSGFDYRHWSEFTAALIIQSLQVLTKSELYPVSIEFMHDASFDNAALRDALGVMPKLGANVNRIVFHSRDLMRPIVSSDPRLLSLLMEHATLLNSPRDDQLSIAVERIVVDRLATGDANLARVSELLNMSQRTLSRRLASEGVSFFEIVETVRKSLALRYLSTREKPLSEIAFLLGYSSLSSFNDAFKRWTGTSPGQYRKGSEAPG